MTLEKYQIVYLVVVTIVFYAYIARQLMANSCERESPSLNAFLAAATACILGGISLGIVFVLDDYSFLFFLGALIWNRKKIIQKITGSNEEPA
jgi:hypothetical protein